MNFRSPFSLSVKRSHLFSIMYSYSDWEHGTEVYFRNCALVYENNRTVGLSFANCHFSQFCHCDDVSMQTRKTSSSYVIISISTMKECIKTYNLFVRFNMFPESSFKTNRNQYPVSRRENKNFMGFLQHPTRPQEKNLKNKKIHNSPPVCQVSLLRILNSSEMKRVRQRLIIIFKLYILEN